jgi:hypothetical protein
LGSVIGRLRAADEFLHGLAHQPLVTEESLAE